MNDVPNDPLIEAEEFLRSFRRPDLIYRDPIYVEGFPGDWVAVATWGAADELGANDGAEQWPIRLRAHSEDGDEVEVYLSTEDASGLAGALEEAIRTSREFPQPEEVDE